jgi:hypothetical protein
VKKATPVEMRKSLEAAMALRNAGIKFVPMPVLNDEDHAYLISELDRRLEIIEEECDG